MLQIRHAMPSDLPAMLEIYNEAVRSLTATFDLEEQTLEERKHWFEKYGGKYPLIVAELNGEVVGYSCLSKFRDKPAYAHTTELSVYISSRCRGRGVGSALMREILQLAATHGYHTVIAGVTGGNQASVKLHEKFGFAYIGCFKEVGFKFGEWQDVHFYQLMVTQQS
ncbi:N-acetyltransferase family protein [Brevibacillus humidisoli]|uniref:GNAT family N-acetyltransferase n=1 Tax=Brevibacillus humidisoli TaxID=2895522 RepID=UPI001E5527CC|nr:GNAT family N-acetyltransferase [Brevibacillus humidisoli]UFJ42325.1 N-acetyltransferase family protein [Brevibacillus humidisoli]